MQKQPEPKVLTCNQGKELHSFINFSLNKSKAYIIDFFNWIICITVLNSMVFINLKIGGNILVCKMNIWALRIILYFSVKYTHKMQQSIKLSVDAVVFGYEAGTISIVLIKRKYAPFKGKWAIPGGFVLNEESLEEAVERELKEETGIEINYLEQLYTFGNPNRDPRRRIVSVAYFGLVHPSTFKIVAATDAEEVQWFKIDEIPDLCFDHKEILALAIKRLQSKITYEPLGFELLDKKFPFSDLEKLYTTVLGRPIDRRNFRKKIVGLNVLDELDEKVSKGSGRPANLFQFNQKRYFQLKKDGIIFEI